MSDVNEFSFLSLIEAYMESGDFLSAMGLYRQTTKFNISLTKVSFVLLLNACARHECLEFGKLLHDGIKDQGFQEDMHVSSSLLNMYAKCGMLQRAIEIFDHMSTKDAVAWASLVAGFAKHGHFEEVLKYLNRMDLVGIPPDPVTLVCGVKACAGLRSTVLGYKFHSDAIKKGYETDSFVGNSLVDMYSKCLLVYESHEVFRKLPSQTTITWNALINGYINNDLHNEALSCFHCMKESCVCPDIATYRCALRACSALADVLHGHFMHAEICLKGWEEDVFLGTALLDMYVKCGYLNEARKVFLSLPIRNVVTWNVLIAGYGEQGFCEEALECVKQMHLSGVPCDSLTYTSCLSAGSITRDIQLVEAIHNILETEKCIMDPHIGSVLVDSYIKCGSLHKAQKAFDNLPFRNIVSWTILMSGYIEFGRNLEALTCIEHMQIEGVIPNTVTYLCMLKACGEIGIMDLSRTVHSEILKKGLDQDMSIANSIVDMYMSCNSCIEAQEVFRSLPLCDVVSWNILIAGYVESGHYNEVLELIEKMQENGVSPDILTYYFALTACMSSGMLCNGMYIHAEIAKGGLESDLVVGSNLVSMYVKHGLLKEAWKVFDSLPFKDVVVWTALIAGFMEQGYGEEAWNLVQWMKRDGIVPDDVFWYTIIASLSTHEDIEKSVVCFYMMQEQGVLPDSLVYTDILESCGNSANPMFGKKIHALVKDDAFEAREEGLIVSLIGMYCKCGDGVYAEKLFDESVMKGLPARNALLAGYAHLGKSKYVIDMCRQGSQEWHPDQLTFLSVLNACCHEGLIDEGLEYLKAIGKVSEQYLTYEHCNCIIDLLARSGHVTEAFSMVEHLPFQADTVTWTILLVACQKWGNLELGREAFKHAKRLSSNQSGTFAIMSNIYLDNNHSRNGVNISASEMASWG
ncbi:hypothetical protein KP509_32G033000 [Ceratopteris richardii]|nr:hypothetical protein KP509_32G033000 [Ceratopteris richardii]